MVAKVLAVADPVVEICLLRRTRAREGWERIVRENYSATMELGTTSFAVENQPGRAVEIAPLQTIELVVYLAC